MTLVFSSHLNNWRVKSYCSFKASQ